MRTNRWSHISHRLLGALRSVYPTPYVGRTDAELAAGLEEKLKQAREWMRERQKH